jgi:hypothetical protein
MNRRTVAESLTTPACKTIVRAVTGQEAGSEIDKVPVCDNAVTRRTTLQDVLCETQKNTDFALQVDGSTDVTNEAQLLAFVRSEDEGEIKEVLVVVKDWQKQLKVWTLPTFGGRSCNLRPAVGTGQIAVSCVLLVSKTVGEGSKQVLCVAVSAVSFIKRCPIKSHVFAKLCESMQEDHVTLSTHKVRWVP